MKSYGAAGMIVKVKKMTEKAVRSENIRPASISWILSSQFIKR